MHVLLFSEECLPETAVKSRRRLFMGQLRSSAIFKISIIWAHLPPQARSNYLYINRAGLVQVKVFSINGSFKKIKFGEQCSSLHL